MSLLDGKKTGGEDGFSTVEISSHGHDKGKGKETLPILSRPTTSKSTTNRPNLSRNSSAESTSLTSLHLEKNAAATTKRPRPPGVGTPGRRGPKRNLPRIVSDDEEEDEENRGGRGGGGGLPASPTPSISLSTYGDGDDEELQLVGGARERKMKRSVSVPFGVVGTGGSGKEMERSASVDLGGLGESGVEGKNRAVHFFLLLFLIRKITLTQASLTQTIRKIVLARLTARGIQRQDEQFKDVFGMTSKGVQFGLVSLLSTSPTAVLLD